VTGPGRPAGYSRRSVPLGGTRLSRGAACPTPFLQAEYRRWTLEATIFTFASPTVAAVAPGFALAGLRGGPIVVTDDGRGIAAQVVRRLAVAGITAGVHATVPPDAHGVIHLGGLADLTSFDSALAVQRDAFNVAQAVAPRFSRSGGVFVTVQDTGGDFGTSGRCPDRAQLGEIATLTRTAAREWPATSVKAIDCERGNRTSAAVADAIVQELLGGGPAQAVGLRADGTRTTAETDGAPMDAPKGEVYLAATSHPYLADHAISGTLVVPVAMVLEWLTGAARAWLPEPGPAVIRNVRVLRKIAVERYRSVGDGLTVQGIRGPGGQVLLELLGNGDARHYRATACHSADVAPAGWAVPTDLKPVWPDVYDGWMLFHGPQFQVIQEVHGISESGAAAVLTGGGDRGWNHATWHTDPAAVDGGLQVAVLWAKQVLGCATLPMGVAEYRTFSTGLYNGPTRCVVRARDVWSGGAECDIGYLAEDGTVRAELFGVSLVPRPPG